ncbi:Rv0361 family membrane protein [Blastococcus sp. SYSU D00820]
MTTTPSTPPVPPPPYGDQGPAAVPAVPAVGSAAGRQRLWVLGGLAAAVVVAVVVVTLVASGGPSSPEDAALQYVNALQEGDYETAYESLCAEEREDYEDLAEYAQEMEQHLGGALTRPARVTGVEPDFERWDVEIMLYTVFGQGDETLEVVEEDGDLLVCEEL